MRLTGLADGFGTRRLSLRQILFCRFTPELLWFSRCLSNFYNLLRHSAYEVYYFDGIILLQVTLFCQPFFYRIVTQIFLKYYNTIFKKPMSSLTSTTLILPFAGDLLVTTIWLQMHSKLKQSWHFPS